MKIPFKVKQVKMYQAVTFEGSSNTYFTNAEYMSVKGNKGEITLEEQDDGCVIVRSAKDMIKVGMANVAYIQYDQLAPASMDKTNLDEAVKVEAAMRAKKAQAEIDRLKSITEADAREKAEMATLKATAETETKALREVQKKAKAEATANK